MNNSSQGKEKLGLKTQDYTEIFEKERPSLLSIGYQMLGERSAAQDLVQDTWEIWDRAAKSTIDCPSAWLRKVISRLAIDALRSARIKRELYVGPWLPEPLVDDESYAFEDELILAKECELALIWAMERLGPEERSAYILRKAFDSDYAEISMVLGKSESTCRKIVSRASQRVSSESLRFDVPSNEIGVLLDKFSQACASMSHRDVLDLLAPDVISVSDGGGRVKAVLRVLNGADEVTRVLLSILGNYSGSGDQYEMKIVNSKPAIVVSNSGEQTMVLTVSADSSGRIAWIYIMRNPDKLC